MIDEQAHQETRAVVRLSLGPPTALLRRQVRVLAAHLADREAVEAVVLAMPGLLRGPADLVAATDRRLIVVGSRRRVRSVEWSEVDGVESGARRTVIRTPGGDLVLGSIAPELGRRAITERAGGRPGRAAGASAVLAAVFGRSAWLHQDDLVRALDELEPGEVVVDLLEAGTRSGLVVLTDRRVGLVPSRRRRPSDWIAFARVHRLVVRDSCVVVEHGAGEAFESGLGPPDRAHAFAERVAARSGAAVEVDDRTDDQQEVEREVEPEVEPEDEDEWEDEWDDAAAGWPIPPDDDIARRLTAFAADLADRLGDVAVVEREFPGWVTLRPASPAAAVLTWADSGHELRVEIDWGRGGVRELDRGAVHELEAAVRAVVAGRLVTGWRGRTVITLPDGRKIRTRRPHGDQVVRNPLRRNRRFLAYAPDVAARLAAGREPRPGS